MWFLCSNGHFGKHNKESKSLSPPAMFPGSKYTKNAFSAEALPSTGLPRFLAGFRGDRKKGKGRRKERGGKGKEGEWGRKVGE